LYSSVSEYACELCEYELCEYEYVDKEGLSFSYCLFFVSVSCNLLFILRINSSFAHLSSAICPVFARPAFAHLSCVLRPASLIQRSLICPAWARPAFAHCPALVHPAFARPPVPAFAYASDRSPALPPSAVTSAHSHGYSPPALTHSAIRSKLIRVPRASTRG
jgi:hypothetical protein